MSGLFITIEGIDGSGKTTQARLLVEWLQGQGHLVRATREPGGTSAGNKIRELVLSNDHSLPPAAELFLYLADRAIHVSEVVKPALETGEVVVCERYTDSTLAYQGYARGLDLALLRRLNEIATGGLSPDLTLVLDLTPEQTRLDETRLDRLESEGLEFLRRVAEGFRELARQEPERIKIIAASQSIAEVQAQLTAAVRSLLERRNLLTRGREQSG